MPGKEIFKLQGSSRRLTPSSRSRISSSKKEGFSKEILNADLETLLHELSEVDRNFRRRNFVFERLEKRKSMGFFIRITGIRLLFSLIVKFNNIINKERDEAFHRQNQIIKDLISVLRKK